ncbi:thrombospondin [Micromonospora sp. KC606]|uniref:thrombospondin n=1 Tax=Micromonospora sp. KC606 TaxID=2530379 RepID=UPI001043663A|nr:thrombospondin [Micromonospora sp. KC606]TDC76365.1 thrombospondin [Micromonospora sp. KC606]
MNFPSLTRRGGSSVQNADGDGRMDGRDGQPAVTDRDADTATYRSNAVTTNGAHDADAAHRAAERGATARAATARPAAATSGGPSGRVAPVDDSPRRATNRSDTDTRRPLPPSPAGTSATATPTTEQAIDLDRNGKPDRVEAPTVAGPKPRTSLLATLGLVVSVVGAAAVLTGTLAGYGIALGATGAVLAVFGLIATRRRHVAGTTDALIGMLVGLAAVVLGIIAMTGQFDWPTTDGDQVTRLREWLDSQFARRV